MERARRTPARCAMRLHMPIVKVFATKTTYPQCCSTDRPPGRGKRAAEYDFALTEALLRYAHDVRKGLPPRDAYKDVFLASVDFDASSALNRALRAQAIHAFLTGLPPVRAEYRQLVAALALYRTVAANGGWPVLKGAKRESARRQRSASGAAREASRTRRSGASVRFRQPAPQTSRMRSTASRPATV